MLFMPHNPSRRLADVLEFKPFKNGLPVQPDSAQDALAA